MGRLGLCDGREARRSSQLALGAPAQFSESVDGSPWTSFPERSFGESTKSNRLLESDVAHGIVVSLSICNKLTIRLKPFKTLDLSLSLSKNGVTFSGFLSVLINAGQVPF